MGPEASPFSPPSLPKGSSTLPATSPSLAPPAGAGRCHSHHAKAPRAPKSKSIPTQMPVMPRPRYCPKGPEELELEEEVVEDPPAPEEGEGVGVLTGGGGATPRGGEGGVEGEVLAVLEVVGEGAGVVGPGEGETVEAVEMVAVRD